MFYNFSDSKIFFIMAMIFILGILFTLLFGLIIRDLKANKEDSREEEDIEGFLFKFGIKQLDLLEEVGKANKNCGRLGHQVNKWKDNKTSYETFMSFYILLPTLFTTTKLFTDYRWQIHITNHNYDLGYFDVKFTHRRKNEMIKRIHFYDVNVFIEACSKPIGIDNTVLTGLLKQAAKK